MLPYSGEKLEKVREVDLYTYLRLFEPEELVRINGKEYCTRTHDSLKISNGKWMWWSRGIGGVSALDYLIKVRGKSFKEAVRILSDMKATGPSFLLSQSSKAKSVSTKKLLLPDESENNEDVIRYLEGRGIDREIIDYCIKNHLLYQSEPYHNCIFLGFDENGEAKYAFYRSVTKARVMGEASGSDKRYSFRLGDNPETIHVFEGVLDLLSYATISKMRGEDWKNEALISLGGVYAPSCEHEQKKLPAALQHYLENHQETKTMCLHLDHDFAGRKATEFISRELKDRYRIRDEPSAHFKDYNDYLMNIIERSDRQGRFFHGKGDEIDVR